MLYKLLSGRHTRIEGKKGDGTPIRKLYRPGALIDLNRKEAEKLGGRVVPHVPHIDDPVDDMEVLAAASEEPVDPKPDTDGEPDTEAEAPEVEEDEATEVEEPDPAEWPGLDDLTVGDVEELVSSMDDAADLRTIYATEQDGKKRVGVFNAVRFRLAALTDAAAGEPDDSTE